MKDTDLQLSDNGSGDSVGGRLVAASSHFDSWAKGQPIVWKNGQMGNVAAVVGSYPA